MAKEIHEGGKSISSAIAIAVSQAKKLAAKGNPKYIKAVAEWEALKAKNAARQSGKVAATMPTIEKLAALASKAAPEVDQGASNNVLVQLAAEYFRRTRGDYYRRIAGKLVKVRGTASLNKIARVRGDSKDSGSSNNLLHNLSSLDDKVLESVQHVALIKATNAKDPKEKARLNGIATALMKEIQRRASSKKKDSKLHTPEGARKAEKGIKK